MTPDESAFEYASTTSTDSAVPTDPSVAEKRTIIDWLHIPEYDSNRLGNEVLDEIFKNANISQEDVAFLARAITTPPPLSAEDESRATLLRAKLFAYMQR